MGILGSMANVFNVQVRFGLDNKEFVKGMKHIEKVTKRVGMSLTKSLTAPIIGLGTAAISASMNFNKGMANVASLMPGNTERMKELKSAVLDLAVAVGEQPGMLTDGLYEMISAFGDSADTMKNMRLMADMAKAGQATLKEAIKLTSGVTKAYGDTSFEAMQKVSDLSLMVVRLGQTSFAELSAAMGQVIPLAAEMGIEIEEVMAVMATLTGVTGNTTEVATQYASALTGLIKQSKSMQDAIESLGFKTSKAMITELGYVDALKALIATTDGTTEALAELFGRKEAVLGILALLGPQAETFNKKLGDMDVVLGTTAEALGEQTEGLNAVGFQWDVFKAKLTTTAIRIGDTVAPMLVRLLDDAIMPLLDKVTELVKTFSEFDAGTQQLILGLVGVVAIIGPFLVGLSGIITVVTAIVGLIGAVGAGILVIIGGLTWIITHWDEFTESWRGAWLEIKRQIIELGLIFTQLWDEIYTAWVKLWDDIVGYFASQIERIKNKAGELTQGIRDSFTWLKDVLVGKSIVPDMVDDILFAFARMEEGIVHVMDRVERAMVDTFTSMPEAAAAAFAEMERGAKGISRRLERAMAVAFRSRDQMPTGLPKGATWRPGGEYAGGESDLYSEWQRMNTIIQAIVSKTGMSWLMASYFASIGWKAEDFKVGDKGEDAEDADADDKAANLVEALGDTLTKSINRLRNSIMSGDIAQGIAGVFEMLGNTIAEFMSAQITNMLAKRGVGELGAGLLGGLGGAAIGIGVSLISREIGRTKVREPGADEYNPIFASITNWDQFYQFGFTLPSSWVLSGRSREFDLDPHGRSVDGLRDERRTDMHHNF